MNQTTGKRNIFDLTPSFHSIIKEKRGIASSLLTSIHIDFLPSSELMKELLDINKYLDEIRILLETSSKSYLKIGRHLEKEEMMTDEEREEMDRNVKLYIFSSAERISSVGKSIIKVGNEASKENSKNIIEYLENKLKKISNIQKTRQQELLINNNKNRMKDEFLYLKCSSEDDFKLKKQYSSASSLPLTIVNNDEENVDNNNNLNVKQDANFINNNDKLLMEAENEQLYNDLLGLEREALKAEKALLEISDLQSQLEQHTLSQFQEVTRLHDESIMTTDTINKGNQHLKQAVKQG
jgi:hypothetical protein